MRGREKQHVENNAFSKLHVITSQIIPSLVVIIATLISTFLSKQTDWMFVFVAFIAYIVAVIAVVVTTACMVSHYNKYHGKPKACTDALDANCEMIAKCSKNCKLIAEKLNTKVSQQEESFEELEKFIINAKKLEEMYVDAVGKLLRTNRDLTQIEKSTKDDSVIYIMTSKFMFEMYNEDMRKTIANNICRGVKYRYIIPFDVEEEFKKMVYVIMAEIQESYKDEAKDILEKPSDFISAVKIPKEYCMLTIVYYEVEEGLSSVIVKLPASNIDEANEQGTFTYLVPKGDVISNNGKKYNSEHKEFWDNMTAIYRKEKEMNKELIYNKSDLKKKFHKGFEISRDKILILE